MIRCVVFDFDGTLVDSNKIKREAFFDVVTNLTGADSKLRCILSDPESGTRVEIFEKLVSSMSSDNLNIPDPSELIDRYTRLCESRISRAPEIKGARICLDRLKEWGLRLWVNSLTPTETLKRIVELRGWNLCFDGISGAPTGKTENLKLT